MHELEQILSTKPTIATAAPSRHTPLRQAAQRLSNRNVAAARAEVLNTALQELAALCYENEGGYPVNIDEQTARILVPVPMGSAGYAAWGLRKLERDVLRRILIGRMQSKATPPLFTYDPLERSWVLNFWDYSTLAAAQQHNQQHPITGHQWRKFYAAHVANDRARREREVSAS